MKMDKYELVLDIIEHPDKYTSEQLQEIMSDPETRKIYILLCKIDSAIEVGAAAGIDVDSNGTLSPKSAIRVVVGLSSGSEAAPPLYPP